jgi:hypothetical protein
LKSTVKFLKFLKFFRPGEKHFNQGVEHFHPGGKHFHPGEKHFYLGVKHFHRVEQNSNLLINQTYYRSVARKEEALFIKKHLVILK